MSDGSDRTAGAAETGPGAPGAGGGGPAGTAAERVKAVLFGYADSSDELPGLVAARRLDDLVRAMVRACYGDALRIAPPGTALPALATAILHYGLTRSLIKSQRRLTHRGAELDVVIPDARTLDSDPGRALVLCIPRTDDPKVIRGKIREIDGVQPRRENVWLVLTEGAADGCGVSQDGGDQDASDPLHGRKKFVISSGGGSFARILLEIEGFAGRDGSGQGQLRILGA